MIPTYNYGRYLLRAVNSVWASHQPPEQLIVIDDGSTDDTAAVAAQFPASVQYVRQANAGVAAARNHGVSLATGDWIVFLDADDALVPEGLTHLRQLAMQHPTAGVVFGRYFSVAPNRRKLSGRLPRLGNCQQNFRAFINREFNISNGTAAWRRQVFQQVQQPVGVRQGEDVAFTARVLAQFAAATTSAPIAEIYVHEQRARNRVGEWQAEADLTVQALFGQGDLPQWAMRYQPRFTARWRQSLAQACHHAHQPALARQAWQAAVDADWTILLDPQVAWRYLRSKRTAKSQ